MSSEPKLKYRNRRALRWGLAAAALLAAGLVSFLGGLQRCTEQALVVGATIERVTTCDPAPLSDPRYIALLVLSLAFLLPDLSELTVGSVTLKARVAAAEDRQSALQEDYQRLLSFVSLQSQQVAQSVSQKIEFLYPDLEGEYRQLSEQRNAEARARGIEATETRNGGHGDLDPARLVMRLLRTAERISAFDLRRRPFDPEQLLRSWPEAAGLGMASVQELAWAVTSEQGDAIGSAQAVRNAVAHGRSIDERSLAFAVGIADEVERSIVNRLGRLRKALDESEADGPKDLGPRFPTEYPGPA